MVNKVKTFHANMLKRYYEQEPPQVSCVEEKGILSIVSVAVMDEDDSKKLMQSGNGVMDAQMECPLGRGKETLNDIEICDDLSCDQKQQVRNVLEDYDHILTDRPGTTNLIEHDIKLTTIEPVKVNWLLVWFGLVCIGYRFGRSTFSGNRCE
ncbi:hypothetical protein DPMN_167938 [Dreissena polymorpha]|uniref:Uncharacterized protein n=1 Tax=Dreissena polymorpha TaxID=45954 RepID=A0A9D4F4P6_DREPO|nr:hypothetical protein DPMN_167938 [Dreissena polymorpha]